jgi:hypothetical protein
MPELLEGLEQLARERGNSLERASQELAGEPEGFLVVARETCKFIGLLSDFWAVTGVRLRKGGVPAKRLLQVCDMLLGLGEARAKELSLVVNVWPERDLPAEMAGPIYADVQAARERLDALLEDVRKTRAWAAARPRIAADPEELKRRIRQADEKGEWVSLTDAGSQTQQGGPPTKE